MEKNVRSTGSAKAVLAFVILGLAFTSRPASAQILTLISPTVNNGGFESSTGTKPFFNSPASAAAATDPIPYWGATLLNAAGDGVSAPADSGAENNPTVGDATNTSATHAGTYGAFWQPSGESTAFNLVTTNPIVAGTVYTLSWYGRTTGAGGAQIVSLFSQATSTVGATYMYQPTATLITVDGLTNPTYALIGSQGPFTLYSLTYTATAADASKYIGVTYGSSGASYIAADDFTLTASIPAPEPATDVLLALGATGVVFVCRFRRASA